MMSRCRRFVVLLGCLAGILLAACGGTAATATPTAAPTATATVAPTATVASTGPAASPFIARPTNAPGGPPAGTTPGTGLPFAPPANVTPGTGPAAPTPATLSAGAVAANSDGSCPADHPIKATRLGKAYHLADQASYSSARAEECFATEADAQAAGYRKAPR